MSEEQQEPKKIKLKIVKTDTPDGQPPAEEEKTTIKLSVRAKDDNLLSDKKNSENENQKSECKKGSAFKITAIVLTAILVVAIIVQICVMVWLKSSTDNLKNKNDKIPPVEDASYSLFVDE